LRKNHTSCAELFINLIKSCGALLTTFNMRVKIMSFSKFFGIKFFDIKLFGFSLVLISFISPVFAAETESPLNAFKENPEWTSAAAVSAVGKKFQIEKKSQPELNTILVNTGDVTKSKHLIGKNYLGDTLLSMDYLVAPGSTAKLFLHGHYPIELKNKNNEWQNVIVKFRAPRFNEASEKAQYAVFLEVRVNGEVVTSNQIIETYDANSATNWESEAGVTTILANQGQFAFRNFKVQPADYSNIIPPTESGGKTNIADLVDYVALGKETFESVGCSVCHSITKDDPTVTTGPNLFGLFTRETRSREVLEGGEGHKFNVKADREYLHHSVRAPTDQLAIGEKGAQKGVAYRPIMPPFSAQIISDIQVDAIGAYLATLNDLSNQGPVVKLMKQGGVEKYNPVEDRLQLLVDDQVRIQRGPLAGDIATGVSGRAIHVGLVNGVNYTFDPRILAIAKIWQGGFLDMTGEFTNRGGKGLKMGFESREISLGDKEFLFAPLNATGETIDFSFKDAKFGDIETVKKSLNSKQDHLDKIAAIDAQFLGYTRNSKDKLQAPSFRYRIGQNTLAVQTTFDANGSVKISVTGDLKTEQAFALNTGSLLQPQASKGKVENSVWTLPAGKIKATLNAKIALASNVWHAPKSTFDNRKQALNVTASKADMPAGYSVESYYPPKDNFGREQLFEALGLAVAADGTIVVGTRTAGIWRLVKNKSGKSEWQLFAEGTFDSLGVVIEDKKGLTVVAGQKAELTRISDTNGDGIADSYETLFDAHSYHGNYHSYMHGPVRGADGAYYLNINLADGSDGSAYNAGGKYMGSAGGFAGWNIRVQADKNGIGKFTPWANGLRSPAGIALSPDGRIWYSDNQGEYVGTSKIFVIEQNKFYGHPASLIDLPGMTPESPEIRWEKFASKRAQAAILLPHNKVANSPGNPAWDTTNGKFGPFAHQMLIGDQTQSNLLRVNTEIVDGVEQGSVMPFIDGLESGVMRPVFLPDGSLLLGQTGRGWQAKGGHVASLQRIVWDGKTVAPAIHSTQATSNGFSVQLTQPLNDNIDATKLKQLLAIESWVYRDAPDYGSDELGHANEQITNINISTDRKQITISLAELGHPSVHPQQTARVYHISLNTQNLFNDSAAAQLHTYYTLYKFAKTN
jgi:cytochrome c2